MSQHADICIEILSKSVQYNLSHAAAADLLESVLYAAGYEDDLAKHTASDVPNLVKSYLRSQRDNLYGISHEQMDAWVQLH